MQEPPDAGDMDEVLGREAAPHVFFEDADVIHDVHDELVVEAEEQDSVADARSQRRSRRTTKPIERLTYTNRGKQS